VCVLGELGFLEKKKAYNFVVGFLFFELIELILKEGLNKVHLKHYFKNVRSM